jgi:hypothetical protein
MDDQDTTWPRITKTVFNGKSRIRAKEGLNGYQIVFSAASISWDNQRQLGEKLMRIEDFASVLLDRKSQFLCAAISNS